MFSYAISPVLILILILIFFFKSLSTPLCQITSSAPPKVSTFILDTNETPLPVLPQTQQNTSKSPQSSPSQFFLTGYDYSLSDVSLPQMNSFTPTMKMKKNNSQRFESEPQSPSTMTDMPSNGFLSSDANSLEGTLLINDPPCSNNLMVAYDTLASRRTGHETSSLSLSAQNRSRTISKSMQRDHSVQPSLLHEAVASTKRHVVVNRIDYKDSDGTKMVYQSRMAITPHDKGESNTHTMLKVPTHVFKEISPIPKVLVSSHDCIPSSLLLGMSYSHIQGW
jgi:hypothetical protein